MEEVCCDIEDVYLIDSLTFKQGFLSASFRDFSLVGKAESKFGGAAFSILFSHLSSHRERGGLTMSECLEKGKDVC